MQGRFSGLEITEVSFIAFIWAFVAGLASFLSPCVLPLLPGYLSYVSGVGVDELGARTKKVAVASGAFVAGFVILFSLQGAAAGLAGSQLGELLAFYTSTGSDGKRLLELIAGVFLVAFGLFILGESLRGQPQKVKKAMLAALGAAAAALVVVEPLADGVIGNILIVILFALVFGLGLFPLSVLERERRLKLLKRPAGLVSVALAGMVFSIGIGPCTGPLLASIYMLAIGTQDPGAGAGLLFVYGMGMGLPFVLSGILFTRAISVFAGVKRHFHTVKVMSAALLMVFGYLLASGEIERLTAWLQGWVPTISI